MIFVCSRTIKLLLLACCVAQIAQAEDEKPKIAVFPLGGDAPAEMREQIGFSLRAKLDRAGAYEPIDGPTMQDAVGDKQFDAKTDVKDLRDIARGLGAEIQIWGEANHVSSGTEVHLRTFDLLQPDPLPHEITKTIHQPTDMRFVVEEILQTLPDVKRFEHPSEQAVKDDPQGDALWKTGANLLMNGGFDRPESWEMIFRDVRKTVEVKVDTPIDSVGIEWQPDGNNALVMRLSKDCAETNGMACLSASIKIEPKTRYRLSFRYQSDGPRLHVFVKGFTMAKTIDGKDAEREIYRRQVPPTGKTDGKWVTVVDELTPKHATLPVQTLRVDLYAYLYPGTVLFDDVVLKAVGKQ
jgi:hypothetical protein